MIIFRHASMKDLQLLKHWDKQPHVIESDPNDDWNWESELLYSPDWREMLIAEIDGRPLGFVQIIDPALEISRYWGDIEAGYRAIDIWIGDANDLGKGYGTVMINLAIERCFSNPDVHTILIDPLASNTNAHRFYEKLGFRFFDERTFGNDHCHVYQLNRNEKINT